MRKIGPKKWKNSINYPADGWIQRIHMFTGLIGKKGKPLSRLPNGQFIYDAGISLNWWQDKARYYTVITVRFKSHPNLTICKLQAVIELFEGSMVKPRRSHQYAFGTSTKLQ